MSSFERVALVTGMPRSGTSWVAQICDSSPEVAFRMSPLFSYEFKNALDESATRQDWLDLFAGAYASTNAFIHQSLRRETGEYPVFSEKVPTPPVLLLKFNRFQNLLEGLLAKVPELRVVAIVRHPCGAIHSWLTAPKEFPPGADPLVHWRSGAVKKTGYGDFFGFDDWKWVTRLHLRLQAERPGQLVVVRYEDVVRDPGHWSRRIFDHLQIGWHPQTDAFLRASQTTHVDTDYSVFKPPTVADRWRDELQPEIRDAILADLRGTDLEELLT